MKSNIFHCPLVDAPIDSDLCIDVQACADGDAEVSLETEEFLEKEDSRKICRECRYHI